MFYLPPLTEANKVQMIWFTLPACKCIFDSALNYTHHYRKRWIFPYAMVIKTWFPMGCWLNQVYLRHIQMCFKSPAFDVCWSLSLWLVNCHALKTYRQDWWSRLENCTETAMTLVSAQVTLHDLFSLCPVQQADAVKNMWGASRLCLNFCNSKFSSGATRD